MIRFEGEGDDAITLDELRAAGADVSDDDLDARISAIAARRRRDDRLHVGHDGAPKGCMLTHGNLRSDIDGIHEILTVTPARTSSTSSCRSPTC